jgi:DNA-binding LytR/AlgR family response regulator
MENIKAIIVDDEDQLRTYLKTQLKDVWPELDICGEAENGEEAIALIEKLQPDIVFLDVRMPGLTGIDVAKKISNSSWIVFVTAFDDYAVEAFENEAIDYLLKPVTTERLKKTVNRIHRRLKSKSDNKINYEQLQKILADINGRNQAETLQWIRAQTGKEIHVISVDGVIFFKSQDKYTLVITSTGEFLIRKPIKELIQKLDRGKFWQINRGVIINVTCIDKVSRSLTGRFQVRLKDYPEAFTVSRAFSHLFRQM